ncbi:MAG: hypothetical protein BMS9Abin23_0659 [Thermodesulfobacteriota bacterium]|nr:MAG: hypothetical protein BMS9Abin23_0659 [Thermodesulfobacteriota bacterium]
MEDIHKECLMALETSLDAIVSVDGTARIRVWNLAAVRVFGYPKEEALGMPVEKIIPEQYRERFREGFKRFVNTGEGPLVGSATEMEGLRKDGSIVPVEITIASLRVNGWQATAVIRDISGRKKLEDELKLRVDETERLNKLMVGRELKMGEMKREIERLKAIIEGASKGEEG